ncbi:hypothetical protein KUTeg_018848, partial [Tegillarca granosa]
NPKKGIERKDYDTCTPYGGTCIRSRDLCSGFVDEWAFGCTDKEVCCHPPPEVQHPEPDHPGKISGIQTPQTLSPTSRKTTSRARTFGVYLFLGTADSRYLQHMQITITPVEQCNASWSGVISDSNICVGSGQEGACQGDSGGPLVCKRGDFYILAGATSWGTRSCQELGYPNVYTRVTSYLDWIHSYIYGL